MTCNIALHDEFLNIGEIICPFCYIKLYEIKYEKNICCSEQDMNGKNTCINCGVVNSDIYAIEYVNFYDNIHRIRKKSVYHRKYHIENVLDGILSNNNIQLTYHQREQIYKVFVEIDSVLNEVNDGRKRMISIKYVIKQLFKMLGLPYKDIDINVTNSKRTLTYYKQYWKKVQSLIGDRIQLIINA